MKRLTKVLLTFVLAAVSAVIFTFSSSAADGKWITAWGTAPTKVEIAGYSEVASIVGPVTARSIITPTASGTKIKFLISNRFGENPIVINSMTVAKSLGGGKIDALSASPVTFNGKFSVTISAGKEIYTDEINFPVTAFEDIAVSTFVEDFSAINTMGLSGGTTYLAMGENDMTKDESLTTLDPEFSGILEQIFGFSGLPLTGDMVSIMPCVVSMDVLSDSGAYSAVVIGDSTVANDFPLLLAESIYKQGITNVGIVGKGIFGNKLMSDGLGSGDIIYAESLLKRLEKDVFSQSGVEYVIVKVGANDIVHPVSLDSPLNAKQPTADELIAGFKQLFEICRNKGKKVIVVGITQWKGNTRDYFGQGPQYVRTDAEFEKDWQIALDVNEWLSSTNEHDGFVSFNEISAGNGKDPAAIYPGFTADGVHPTTELQKLWAEFFPQSLIGIGSKTAGVMLDKTAVTVYKGITAKIKATVYPETAENKNVTWESSDTTVATVDKSGKVTALKNGSAVISCTTEEGGFTAKCKITVKTKATGVKLETSSGTVYTTKGITIKASVLPSDASDKTLTYKSSNTSIATVSSKGYVIGVGAGTATITVTDSAGNTAKYKIKVLKKSQVTAIELNYETKGVYTGRTLNLKATVLPTNATYKDVEWLSSDKSIATVTDDGVVKGISAGKARITCKSIDNPMVSMTCVVTVKVKTTGVTLNAKSITVYTTTTKQLKATVLPSNATNKKVTWESEDPDIATVDKNGVVAGKKTGTTYIICTTNNSERTATCKVTVKKGVLSKKVTLNKTKISIYDGKTYTLKPTVSPENTTTKTVTWKSSNTKVAKVSSKGVVTAINPGTATITCTTKDTGKTVKCTVTVKKVVPKAVMIDKDYYQVGYKKSIQLTATVSPSNSTDKTLVWSSSNPNYAKVSSTGKVTGLKSGKTVVITVTTKSGKRVDRCEVYVGTVAAESVKLNKSSATIGTGSTLQLKATVSPSTATNKNVKWYSNSKSVATVNSKGKVTALKPGTALISCVTVDGEYVAICRVVVKDVSVQGVKLDKNSLSLSKGDTYTLKATIVPDDASNQAVTWESTNSAIAKVNKNGKVTAVSAGSCKIRVVTDDGNCIATCIVTVR